MNQNVSYAIFHVYVIIRRPSGDASEDIQAHLIPVYIQQRDRLQKINERYNRENSRLQRQVQTQRRRLLENQTTASTKCDSLLQVNYDFLFHHPFIRSAIFSNYLASCVYILEQSNIL